jgi:hypothetical protein
MPENNTNTPNINPAEMKTPVQFNGQHHSHLGPVLGILVIMLILILGGLYLWGSMLNEQARGPIETPIINNEPETPRAVADQEILETLSPSDDLGAIEADLSATALDTLTTDLDTIDAELDAALVQ